MPFCVSSQQPPLRCAAPPRHLPPHRWPCPWSETAAARPATQPAATTASLAPERAPPCLAQEPAHPDGRPAATTASPVPGPVPQSRGRGRARLDGRCLGGTACRVGEPTDASRFGAVVPPPVSASQKVVGSCHAQHGARTADVGDRLPPGRLAAIDLWPVDFGDNLAPR